jgi:hypothetical protein
MTRNMQQLAAAATLLILLSAQRRCDAFNSGYIRISRRRRKDVCCVPARCRRLRPVGMRCDADAYANLESLRISLVTDLANACNHATRKLA